MPGISDGNFEMVMSSMQAALVAMPLLMLTTIALMGYDKKLRHVPALSVQLVSRSAKAIQTSWLSASAEAPSMSPDNDLDDIFVIHGATDPRTNHTPANHRRPRHTGAHRRSRLSGLRPVATRTVA